MTRASAATRRTPFALVVGLAAGILTTGLLVPFVRTEPAVSTTSGPNGVLGAGTAQTVPGGPAAASGAGGTTPGTPGASATPGAGPAAAGGPSAGPGAAPGATGTPGTDAGVTETEVRLGIALLDVGIAEQFGETFDLGNQRGRWEALIADQNAKGGINGRKIVADYRTFDAGKPVETQQAACVAWTKDVKVFTVMVHTTLNHSAAVCIMGEGATPIFTTDGIDASYYGNGLYFSLQASDNRILRDHAAYMIEKGLLDGKTIGVLSGDGAERLAIDNTLVPALAEAGHEVAAIEVVPATTAGTQRIPIAISNFKAKKVDFLVIAANVVLNGPFVQSANRSGFNPQYSLSDFNNQINDQVADYFPDVFEGTIGLSTHTFPDYRAGRPAPPADQACLDRVARVDPKVVPFQASAHEVGLGECAIFDAWVKAALGAGPNLNRPNLIAAAETAGQFGIAGTLDGSFGPGKHDAVDFEREVAWRRSCKCWQLVNPDQVRRMVG